MWVSARCRRNRLMVAAARHWRASNEGRGNTVTSYVRTYGPLRARNAARLSQFRRLPALRVLEKSQLLLMQPSLPQAHTNELAPLGSQALALLKNDRSAARAHCVATAGRGVARAACTALYSGSRGWLNRSRMPSVPMLFTLSSHAAAGKLAAMQAWR